MTEPHSFLKIRDDAYASIGIFDADIVYLYSDFRGLGTHVAEFTDRSAFCHAVVQPLLDRGKTVLTPTFTYTTQGRFDTRSTPTKLGALNKWILGAEGCRRSEHPLFSYAAIGPRAAELMDGIGKSAFGHDSVFDRLYGRNASFLYVGRPVRLGNTIIHHVEQVCGATYRVNKSFKTEVYRGDDYIGTDYSALLRRRDIEGQSFAFRFEEAAELLLEAGLVRQVGDERALRNFSAHDFDATAVFLKRLFYRNSSIFIDGTFNE